MARDNSCQNGSEDADTASVYSTAAPSYVSQATYHRSQAAQSNLQHASNDIASTNQLGNQGPTTKSPNTIATAGHGISAQASTITQRTPSEPKLDDFRCVSISSTTPVKSTAAHDTRTENKMPEEEGSSLNSARDRNSPAEAPVPVVIAQIRLREEPDWATRSPGILRFERRIARRFGN